MPLPTGLMLVVKQEFVLTDFVESGTYYGETAVWASSHFARVTTIEYSRMLYEKARDCNSKIKNIEFVLGDSRQVLKQVCSRLTGPALFWLDAHWSAGETYGEGDECPLLAELKAIVASEWPHYIFIDDAHMFLSPPPRPHRVEQWPTIGEVFAALQWGKHSYYIVVIENVIVAVPEAAKRIVARYCQDFNTRALRARAGINGDRGSQARRGWIKGMFGRMWKSARSRNR